MPRRSLLLGYLAPSGLRVRLRPPCFSNAPTRRCGERRAGTLPPARRAWLVGADGPSTVLTRFKLLLASHSCSAHSTKANNGIPIVTTVSSVSGALTEQLIFEFASLSSWPMDCADFLRNLISIRTAIPHYLNKYRTITTTDTKASTQLLRSRELLRRASGRKCNQKASGESIECHATGDARGWGGRSSNCTSSESALRVVADSDIDLWSVAGPCRYCRGSPS